jgi:hypothetical protein
VWLEEGLSLPPSTALSVMACLSSTARGDAASTPFLCLCACKRPRCQPQQLQLPCRRPQPLQSQNHKLNYTTNSTQSTLPCRGGLFSEAESATVLPWPHTQTHTHCFTLPP